VPCCDLLRLSLLTRRFVRSGRTSLRDSGGRFDLSYIFTCIYMARPVVSPSSSSLLPATLTARRQLARRLPAWSACLVYLPASKRQHSRVVIVSVCLEFHKEGCFVLPPPARSAGQGVPAGRQAGAGGKMHPNPNPNPNPALSTCPKPSGPGVVGPYRSLEKVGA